MGDSDVSKRRKQSEKRRLDVIKTGIVGIEVGARLRTVVVTTAPAEGDTTVGGALSVLPGRLDFGYELRWDDTFGPWEPDVLPEPPSAYINRLYLDTMSFHTPAVMCAVGTVGVDHVVFGSDHPPVPIPLVRSVEAEQRLPLDGADRSRYLGGNGQRIPGSG